MAIHVSTVVEHSTRDLKFKGSNPVNAVTGREKIEKESLKE
jgi:hypothetical protein